jgi:HK97 family phage prohead protease
MTGEVNNRRPFSWSPERKRLSLPIDSVEVSDGSFSGYASLFGQVDLGKDRVVAGAFSRSLKKRGVEGIRMLFQHEPSEPIGVWDTIEEDQNGLFVSGHIVQSSQRGKEVMDLLRQKAIDGLSIGFKTERSRTDRKTGIRSILEADLWEISVVTFPMLPGARVQDVKSVGQQTRQKLPSIRHFEKWLTQDAGLTRRQARTVIQKGYAHLESTREAASSEEDFLCKLQSAAKSLNPKTKQTGYNQ